mgnify:CR=1 FL=1|jgi:hypothetical protein
MEDIFEIKFPIESEIKDNVITKFSSKQGGAFAIFSYYWQCFVWAASIGFLRNERRPLARPTERIFTLNTIRNNGGEKDAQALICMCIARFGSLEIMKHPEEAITMISEYANGGFYHIQTLMANGENSFNDFEKVKQEIFSRDYAFDGSIKTNSITLFSDEELEGFCDDIPVSVSESENGYKPRRWTTKQIKDLVNYYKSGISTAHLALLFETSEEVIKNKLSESGMSL